MAEVWLNCILVVWKAELELVSNEFGDLAEQTSKQNVEGLAWLLAAQSKMREETEKLR